MNYDIHCKHMFSSRNLAFLVDVGVVDLCAERHLACIYHHKCENLLPWKCKYFQMSNISFYLGGLEWILGRENNVYQESSLQGGHSSKVAKRDHVAGIILR